MFRVRAFPLSIFGGVSQPARAVLPALFLLLLLFGAGCHPVPPDRQPPAVENLFEEISAAAGLTVTHQSGPVDEFPMPQSMGSGCALLDANGDGRLDVLLIAGDAGRQRPTETAGRSDTVQGAPCSLLLQTADGRLADHTENANIIIHAYGMGVAAGDVDNDGDTDLVITTSNGAQLFLNNGAAVFEDVTTTAGIRTSRWTTAACLFDFDRDGWLDLMVTNYVDYIPGSICEDGTGRRDYCGPLAFQPTVDRLYRNLGSSGRPAVFEDVTVPIGIVNGSGKGLGLICSDLTGDQLPDIYVANDSEPNRLWVQQPDGSFVDEAILRGCAVDFLGKPQASMGTAFADIDDDGLQDLFLTHLRGETNTIYRQLTPGVFTDQTSLSGLGNSSLDYTGFGTAAIDIDCDGDLDLLIGNGKVMRSGMQSSHVPTSHWDEYAERNQILLNERDNVPDSPAGFREFDNPAEPFLQAVEVTRGLAVGDFDNDGDMDVLISSAGAPARLFRNVARRRGNWLVVRVVDPALNREAFGARLRVICGDRAWVAEVQPGTGYLSSHDPRVHFGLSSATAYDAIEVTWPDRTATVERFAGGPANQLIELKRGSGQIIAPPDAPGHEQ